MRLRISSSDDDQATPSPAKFKKKCFPTIKFLKKRKLNTSPNGKVKKIRPPSLQTKKRKLLSNTKEEKKRKLHCEICKETFPSWWEIREHWLSSGHRVQEMCRWCNKKTFALQSHLCKQHWNQATMCPYCGQLFMFQEDQEKHVKGHTSTEYRCFLCGRRRKNEELLKTHMLSHFIYEKYGCNVCEKRFKKKKNMERHLKQIHFVCQYCGRTCENRTDFNIHLKIHDDLICLLCRKSFSQKNRLKYHYQLQHGHQDFYQCTLCFQRFSMKSRLLNHMKLVHKGTYNYSCSVCEAPFLYWQLYVNHFEKEHAEPTEKPIFKCSSCDFTTDMKVKLQWHVEKTSGDGFFCKKCQVRFKCKGLFEKHMEAHYGEKVWVCDHCDRSYSSDSTLKHHLSVYHKDELVKLNPQVYPCLKPGCDAFYSNSSSLARHVRRTHSSSTSNYRGSYSRSNKNRKLNQSRKSSEENPVDSTDDNLNKGYHHLVDKLPDESEVDVYSCDICKRFWFTGESLFRKHMNEHEETLWNEKCAVCDKTLESPEDAVSHYSVDHLNVKVEFIK